MLLQGLPPSAQCYTKTNHAVTKPPPSAQCYTKTMTKNSPICTTAHKPKHLLSPKPAVQTDIIILIYKHVNSNIIKKKSRIISTPAPLTTLRKLITHFPLPYFQRLKRLVYNPVTTPPGFFFSLPLPFTLHEPKLL